MANMNFGVNLLPKTTNTYSLGNSDKKWNLFVNEINGTTFNGIPTYSVMTGATSLLAGTSGLVPAPTTSDPNNYLRGDGTWNQPVVILTYGVSTYTDFINAYNAGAMVYCRATVDTKDQTLTDYPRYAALSYVNSNPELLFVEFLYYRATLPNINNYSNEVIIYKLTGDGTWSATQIYGSLKRIDISGDGLSKSWDNDVLTLTTSAFTGATSSAAGTGGMVPAPTTTDVGKFLCSDGTWATVSGGSGSGNGGNGILGVTLASTTLAADANGVVNIPAMGGCTSSTAGSVGAVPAPAAGDEDKFLSGDGTWKSGGLPMVILSYGSSTWAEFEAAYNNNVIVYTRASSNSNPATGSQTRMAFMAYVNNATTPTEVEFQYYRSMSSHSATAMGDQVFVYKLTKTGGWSVTSRDASIKEIKIDSSSSGTVSWSSNKVTLTSGLPAVTSSDNGKILKVVDGAWAAVSPE